MKFSVIYEFECGMDDSVSRYTFKTRSFDLTERYDGEPSEWCSDLWNGKCKHRKYAGILNRNQFDEFVRQTEVWADDVETLGSIGAPGFGYGVAPAISFSNNDPDVIQSAYITPIPSVEPKQEITPERSERIWYRVRNAVLSVYGR